MITQGQRLALIVASSQFTDQTLQKLIAPSQDADGLARVLEDPAIGNFKVKLLIDRTSYDIRIEIEDFFASSKQNDLLLLYFSGHGIKDDDGRLYLATIDTKRERLRSTTVQATFVNEAMTFSRSRRQVLILDCCHSGAFARGMVVKGGETVDISAWFEGRGRFVLTASSTTQYAFQGNEIIGESSGSVFTHYLVQGLETGEADLNGNGWISLDELHAYVSDRVTDEMPQQTPGKWVFGSQRDIYIARNPLKDRLAAQYRDKAEQVEWLLQLIATRDEHLFFICLHNNRLVLSYLREAVLAGLNMRQLPRGNLGAMLEFIVQQITKRDGYLLSRELGQMPSTEELCRLSAYLGWYMFNEGITSCDATSAAAVVEEILTKMQREQYNVEQILDWLAATYWFQKTVHDTFEFRDSYIIDVFAAMELKKSAVRGSALLGLQPAGDPTRWQKVIVLLAGMLTQDQAIELLEVLLEAGLIQLAGWCIAEGQPMPQSIVARVTHTLQTQLAEVEQQ